MCTSKTVFLYLTVLSKVKFLLRKGIVGDFAEVSSESFDFLFMRRHQDTIGEISESVRSVNPAGQNVAGFVSRLPGSG